MLNGYQLNSVELGNGSPTHITLIQSGVATFVNTAFHVYSQVGLSGSQLAATGAALAMNIRQAMHGATSAVTQSAAYAGANRLVEFVAAMTTQVNMAYATTTDRLATFIAATLAVSSSAAAFVARCSMTGYQLAQTAVAFVATRERQLVSAVTAQTGGAALLGPLAAPPPAERTMVIPAQTRTMQVPA